jgi:hypothetical protein
MTSKDTTSTTSSPESEDGPLPSDSPGGPTTDLFGQEVAPASRSAPPADKAAQMTKDISGLSGFGSSASVALTLSLANRLRDRLGSGGSTEYSQTWKRKITPVGRRYWAHTASGRRTSDSGSGGWPSPKTDDGHKRPPEYTLQRIKDGKQIDLGMLAQLAGWMTPTVEDSKSTGSAKTFKKHTTMLHHQVKMAGWATPNVPNGGRSITHAELKGGTAYHKGKKVQIGLEAQVKMAGWATPRQTDGSKNVRTPEGAMREAERKGTNNDLGVTAQLAGWATPAMRDHKGANSRQHVTETGTGRRHMDQLPNQARYLALASGQPTTSSPAPMENRGALNPAFSLWLMGFPPAWESCAPLATRSSRKSRRSS